MVAGVGMRDMMFSFSELINSGDYDTERSVQLQRKSLPIVRYHVKGLHDGTGNNH
jgi:hypothetical protein